MNKNVNNKILFVDDDKNLLHAISRHFKNKYNVIVAEGALKGLDVLKNDGPFAVVISDMRMPDMNGIQFLSKAREVNQSTVRIMLTGNADLNTAMHAVNEGNIYRFLVKPCRRELLEWAIEAAIEQYRLITAEKELLENTLKGSIQVLIDILTISNPTAFSKASRLKDYVSQIIKQLNLAISWQYELAALLSQIGCIALPSDILTKVYLGSTLTDEEEMLYNSHPDLGSKLISRIPRLDSVAEMISKQRQSFNDTGFTPENIMNNRVILGSQLLKVVTDFDSLIFTSNSRVQALVAMKSKKDYYVPIFLKALEQVSIVNVESEVKEVQIKELKDRMFLAQDIYTKTGLLVAPKGQKMTLSLRVRLENYAYRKDISSKLLISSVNENISSRKPISEKTCE